MSESVQQPFALALLVCDFVWIDAISQKRTILGTFSALHAPSFPLRMPQLAVYMRLTDGRGQVALKVRIVDDADEREPVLEWEGTIDMPDPMRVHDGHIQVANIVFPEPGLYRVQLYACGSLLIERRIEARLKEVP